MFDTNYIRRIAFLTLVMTALLTSVARASAPYCLALRGNGPGQPAHWGALANMVEKLGLPWAQAGGSSASISMFLLDAIAVNPWVKNATPEQQKSRASFLLKSIFGVVGYIGQTKDVRALKDVASRFKRIQELMKELDQENRTIFDNLESIAQATSVGQIFKTIHNIDQVIDLAERIGIAETPRYAKFIDDLKHIRAYRYIGKLDRVKFYAGEIKEALKNVGAFNAEGDTSLFFRDGIVNFETFGMQIGQIASFLSGRLSTPSTVNEFNKYTQMCEPVHTGLTWQGIVAKKPECQTALNSALNSFFSQTDNREYNNFAKFRIGTAIASFPQTTVLVSSAYEDARKIYEDYHKALDRDVAKRFHISNSDDVKFGYWGRPDLLRQIERNLNTPFTDALGRRMDFSNDGKSRRFLALGNESSLWIDALALSPAEPGLAAILPMNTRGNNIRTHGVDAYSAGGWSDLHPVLILKAAGCERVVYVTRKGGESFFGQGVAKRLLNLERDWSLLSSKNPVTGTQNRKMNKSGDLSDLSSPWSMLYNLGNPLSSFSLSLSTADAVLCTNWDNYSFATQLREMVDDGYYSSYVANTREMDAILRSSKAKMISSPYEVDPDGVPTWAGCRAPQK